MKRGDATDDLTGRTMVITGSNSGIGKEAAVTLAGRGAHVVITARNPERGQAALDEVRRRSGSDAVTLGHLDLGSLASVREFAAWVLDELPRLDVLVNNGGLITGERRETADGFEEMFGVNHLGHFLLTNLLIDRLVESAPSRVLVVSSIAHRLVPLGLPRDDLQSLRRFKSSRAYARSKLANVMFAGELARRLDGRGVTVNALHPGSIASEFGGSGDTRFLGQIMSRLGGVVLRRPASGSRTTVMLAASDDPRIAGTTGAYFSTGFRSRASRAARDEEAGRWLWEISEQLIAQAEARDVVR